MKSKAVINQLSLLLILLLLSFSSFAQSKAEAKEESQDILNLINSYLKSRETKDTVLLKKILTKDVDQLVSSGVWRSGISEAIEGMMESSVANPGERALHVDRIRFINDDVALVDARYEIKNPDGSMRKMWSSFVVNYHVTHWKIAAIRNMLPAGN